MLQDDILYLYEALETLVASKGICNPLQEGGSTEPNYPTTEYPTLLTDFPVTASSSEGGATATTIEMVEGENGETHESSESAMNNTGDRKISESISVSSTVPSK